MNKIEHVLQKEFGHCGLACLAMITGANYETLLNLPELSYDLTTEGMSDKVMQSILDKFKITNTLVYAGIDLHVPKWGRAILSVPSLGTRGLIHYIVYDIEQGYLDPSSVNEGYNNSENHPKIQGEGCVFPVSAILIGDTYE